MKDLEPSTPDHQHESWELETVDFYPLAGMVSLLSYLLLS